MRLTRLALLVIAVIIAVGFYLLTRQFLDDVEPQTYQVTEEALVDTAHVLAAWIEQDMLAGSLDETRLRSIFAAAHRREFEARIFDHVKRSVGLNLYITDAKGMVLFDSHHSKNEGQDFSRKLDVKLTLEGKYGARSSRTDDANPLSSVLHIAAPIGDPQRPIGVLTVYKPQADALPMIEKHRRIIWWACGLIGGGILLLIGAVFVWVYRPIEKITDYARAIERGERPLAPKLGAGREVNTLAHALDSMREAIEGRRYAERYIQTLTHEMKSPLAAIRGAAELLDEDMPRETRTRFLENIRQETARGERLINRLLELSAIESKQSLDAPETLDLREIVQRALAQAQNLATVAGVALNSELPESPVPVCGDAFILRAALTNLLENAIDFSPRDAAVELALRMEAGQAVFSVRDHGPGIPAYARERIFERFYSLRHHSAGRKGTGLGLTLVREAAELHGGDIFIECPETGGTLATLTLRLDG